MARGDSGASSPATSGAVFFFAFVVGAGAIIIIKLLDFPQLIATAIPVLIMCLYALASWMYRGLRVRLDQAGDNLYYLGFLYTLTSLAYSLYEFAGSDKATEGIITNFGIAIATTIVGLAFRVLFAQTRMDPTETEHVARLELADASRRLRRELDNSVRQFSQFRMSMQQTLAEGADDLNRTIDNSMKGGLQRFESSVNTFSNAVETANEGFEKQTRAVGESTGNLVSTLGQLTERIGAIEVAEDLLEQKLRPSVETLEDSAKQLASTLETVQKRLLSLELSPDEITGALSSAVTHLDSAAERLRAASSADNVRSNEWKELGQNLKAMLGQLRENLEGLHGQTSALVNDRSDLSVLLSKLDEMPASLTVVQDALRSQLTTIERLDDSRVQEFQGIMSMLRAALNEVTRTVSGQRPPGPGQ